MKIVYLLLISIIFFSCEKSTIPLGEIEHSVNFTDTSSLLFLDFNKDTGEPELSIRAEIEIETYPDSFFIDKIEVKLLGSHGSFENFPQNYTINGQEFKREGNRLKFQVDKFPVQKFSDNPRLLIIPNINTVYRNELFTTAPPILINTNIEYRSQDPNLSYVSINSVNKFFHSLTWNNNHSGFYYICNNYTSAYTNELNSYNFNTKELKTYFSTDTTITILGNIPGTEKLILLKFNSLTNNNETHSHTKIFCFDTQTEMTEEIIEFNNMVESSDLPRFSDLFFNKTNTKFILRVPLSDTYQDKYFIFNYPNFTIENEFFANEDDILCQWSDDENQLIFYDNYSLIDVRIDNLSDINYYTTEYIGELIFYENHNKIFSYYDYYQEPDYFFLNDIEKNIYKQKSFYPLEIGYPFPGKTSIYSQDLSKILFVGKVNSQYGFYLFDLNN